MYSFPSEYTAIQYIEPLALQLTYHVNLLTENITSEAKM